MGKCFYRGMNMRNHRRFSTRYHAIKFRNVKFPIQPLSLEIPRSVLLQVTEKNISWCGECKASHFSFSSMLHQTRPIHKFFFNFLEGCAWKVFWFTHSLFTFAVRCGWKMIRLLAISLIVMVALVLADPTMYKKNEQNLYEPGEYWSRKKKIRRSKKNM